MAQDSLGKKTHLPHVLQLFWNASKIWNWREVYDVSGAEGLLDSNSAITRTFASQNWPFDKRSRQALCP